MFVATISAFFLLSLLGAYVLFKYLKSEAQVSSRWYQAGGALAGFVIIYGLLYGSYYQIVSHGPEITGKVAPALRSVKLVLSVAEQEPDNQGDFKLTTPFNLDLQKSDVRLYLLTQGDKVFEDSGTPILLIKHFTERQEMKNLDIKSELRGR